MTSNPLLLGVDVGTSSIKALIIEVNEKDNLINIVGEESQPLSILYGPEGKVEQNPYDYFDKSLLAIKCLIKRHEIDASNIIGVGISSQCPTLVFLDANGICLDNAILYMDRRAKNACEIVVKELGEETLFKITKNVADPYFAGYKLIWLSREKQGLYENVSKILSVGSFLAYKLTDVIAIDWITACTFAPFYDWLKMQWNEELLKKFGLSSEKLPDKIIPPYGVVGTLTSRNAEELGLPRETPVVIGTCDAQAAALAAGATSNGDSILICGTTHLWEVIHTEESKFTKYFLNGPYIFPGLYLSAAALMTTGAVIEWFLMNFIPTSESRTEIFKALEAQARTINPGSDGLITLPYFMGERSPIWDPNAKGVIIGLTLNHKPAHLYRSILEGVAFALRSCGEIFESLKLMPKEVIAVNGAAKNRLWMEIISTVLGVSIKAPRPKLGSAAGAAILSGYGIKLFKKPEEIKKFIHYETLAEPNPEEIEIYNKNYRIFKELYWVLRKYMHEL